jgi:hypothetical protein
LVHRRRSSNESNSSHGKVPYTNARLRSIATLRLQEETVSRTGLLIAALAIAISAPAAPIDCTAGTLADYLALPLEGCRVGTADFTEFTLGELSAGSQVISPASISVTPVFDLLRPGLLFGYHTTATGPDILQSVIEFLVTSPDPPHFTFGTLQIAGSSADGGGVALVTSDLCLAGFFVGGVCSASSEFLTTTDAGFFSQTFDRRDFASQSSIAVRHDMVLDGAFDGVASLGTAELRIGEVAAIPEPATVSTVFAAILGVIAAVRRRRQR